MKRTWAAKPKAKQGQLVAIVGLVLLLSACEDSLPIAPSELVTGIVIYEHANYLGKSAHVTQTIESLTSIMGPCSKSESSGPANSWGECVSSIRVAPGWRAILYRGGGWKGDQLEVTGDIPNLQLASGECDHGGFNDCVESIRLFRP